MEAFRSQVAANGSGEFRFGGKTVRIVYDSTDGRFLSSNGNGGLFT